MNSHVAGNFLERRRGCTISFLLPPQQAIAAVLHRRESAPPPRSQACRCRSVTQAARWHTTRVTTRLQTRVPY